MQHHEPLTTLGVDGAAGEVVLTARRRVVLPADGLGCALAEEVDGERGVHRHEVAFVGDDAGVVHVTHRMQFDCGVLVEEPVQTVGSERERADGLGAVESFADTVDHARLHQVDHAVGHEFGVDPEVLVTGERCHDRVRDGTDACLDRGTVGDAFGDERGDLAVGVAWRRGWDLDEWAVAAAPADHLRQVQLVSAERARHVVGDLEEESASPDEARRVVGRHPEREVAVAVRR